MKRKVLLALLLFTGMNFNNLSCEDINAKETKTVSAGIISELSEIYNNEVFWVNDEVCVVEDADKRLWHPAYVTANVNIRAEPSTDSEIIGSLYFNHPIIFVYENPEWVQLPTNGKNDALYISSKYITLEENPHTDYDIPKTDGFKSYMSYKAITNESSDQYKLQKEYAYDGKYGIREIKGRFCVAVGTGVNAKVGDYIDLILENNSVIPCVVSDIKDDRHTEDNNIVTAHNNCVSEFIVNTKKLPSVVKNDKNTGTGDISDCQTNWKSPVKTMRVFKKNILN